MRWRRRGQRAIPASGASCVMTIRGKKRGRWYRPSPTRVSSTRSARQAGELAVAVTSLESPSPRIARQAVVNVSGGNGGLAGGDADLVQFKRHVAGGVKARHRRAQLLVDKQAGVV